jgi:hypothetical protein
VFKRGSVASAMVRIMIGLLLDLPTEIQHREEVADRAFALVSIELPKVTEVYL